MKVAATVIAIVLALAAEAAAKSTRPALLAIVWPGGDSTEIVKLDALSMKSISRRARVGKPSWFIARSPTRDRAVFTVGRDQDRLRFFDVRRMRFAGELRIAGVQASLWPDAQRLILLTARERTSVFLVDPVARRVLVERVLEGSVTGAARNASRLVALLTPKQRIGPARLAIIDADGTVREVALPTIRAGGELVDPSSHTFRQEAPGVAIDPTGTRALVIPAYGSIAEVDLVTLGVALHPLKTRALAARRKALEGWQRLATWFGPHLVAVTGTDQSLVDTSTRMTAAGLTLIDTRDWSARMIEPRATSVAIAGDRLLVSGPVWNSETRRAEGMGLSGYGPDGIKRFHLFGRTDVPDVQILGRYAYLAADNNTRYTIVDPSRGVVVRRVSMRAITTLVDG